MTDRDTDDALLTKAEVAATHRVSYRTVERWITANKLKAQKLPTGGVRIRKQDSDALLTPVKTEPSGDAA